MVKMMKAWVFDRVAAKGDFSNLEFRDVPIPRPGPDEALVQVVASAANPNDYWARQGRGKIPMPHISGSDACGVVVEVGAGVTEWKAGDEVITHCGKACHLLDCRFCASEDVEYDCHQFRIWGFDDQSLDGAYAEYVVLPAWNLLPKPSSLSRLEAAGLSLAGVTAWRMLVGDAHLDELPEGQKVLILGAAGGTGHFAVQIARAFGHQAIAIVSSEEKAELVMKLGATQVVLRRGDDEPAKKQLYKDVRKIAPDGVDVVFDHMGGSYFELCLKMLRRGGTLVSCGSTTDYHTSFNAPHIFFFARHVHGALLGSKRHLKELIRYVEEGKIRPHVGAVFGLKDLPVGQKLLESGQAVGKIVFIP